MSPAPVSDHSTVEHRLSWWLQTVAPDDLRVFGAVGINFNADRTHHRIPDAAVFRWQDHEWQDYERPYQTRPPLLAVEVVSPESALRGFTTKWSEYAEFGIHFYRVVGPSRDQPGIVEYRLEKGTYREKAMVYGTNVFVTDFPFPVSVVPHWLFADDPAWRQHIGGPASSGAAD